jgi:hypothetical protein
VARRVLLGRAVAASDMPALRAAPQVQPPALRGEALDTSIARRGHVGIDRGRLIGHRSTHIGFGIRIRTRTRTGIGIRIRIRIGILTPSAPTRASARTSA